MKDQILKIAGVKSEKEFYKKYPSEEAFMKAHGKAFKKAAMGSKMVNDQLHQLTDFGNPPIAQKGIGLGMTSKPKDFSKYLQGTDQPGLNPDGTIKQVGDAFNNAAMAQMSGQQMAKDMSAQFATPSSDQLLVKNDINSGAKAAESSPAFDAGAAGMAALGALPKLVGGIEAIGAQKKAREKNKQSNALGNLALQAQQTAQAPKRKYVRPEDNIIQPGQIGNPYGSGTNFLAENGTMIGGNPTEIQNMYNPGDMYNDLGFEPLEETYKQYRRGGNMPKAEFGDYFADSGEAQIGSAVGGAVAAGFGLPPALGEIGGKLLTNVLGIGKKGAREAQRLKQEGEMTNAQLTFGQNNQLGAFRKNGGWVSNDWQPQTFTKFGEYDAKDLLKPPHDADMLRSGGHLAQVPYTPPSAEAMFTGRPNMPQAQFGAIMGSINKGMIDTVQNSEKANKLKQAISAGMMEQGGKMAFGGELQIGDGGYAETLSYNPNLPGGEIGMFRGASHDNGGIQTQYGENGVEVEGGEPFTILENNNLEDDNNLEEGGSNENLVVFGNIKINKNIADLMGDPKAKGKKFKTYIADVAKDDAKQLKRINKGLEMIEDADENSADDHIKLITGKAIVDGATAWQKINADKIKEAALVQDAIHQEARELGVKSDKLAEGKLEKETDPSMMAKNGKKMKKAQAGLSSLKGLDDEALLDPDYPERMELLKAYYSANEADRKMIAQGLNKPGMMGVGANNLQEVVVTGNRNKSKKLPMDIIPYERKTLPSSAPVYIDPSTLPNIEMAFQQAQPKSEPKVKDPRKPIDWERLGDIGKTALSYLEPWLRPSNANEQLNPDQLMGEYYALANNQLEPVQAQTFQPMLDTPMDISLNDQINAIDAQARAAIRAAGSNQSAQAAIMAQALEAKNKVLGEQTRMNATNKIQTYDKNRALVNDAKLKNLAILDQQYVRQSQAKSNTKAQTQAALNSISAKVAQQRAANRKLAVMENMYNFRFSPSGRAINYNGLAQFDTSGMNAKRSNFSGAGLPANKRFTIDSVTGEPVGIRTLTKDEMAGNTSSLSELDSYLDTQKNGGKTSKKNARNSSIVKALKNL